MKKGDIVRHKYNRWIGTVTDVLTDLWYIPDLDEHKPDFALVRVMRVKWFDAPKKYRGLYEEANLELYTNSPKDEVLTDWLYTSKERMRALLTKKQDKFTLNRIKQGKIRLDGRR